MEILTPLEINNACGYYHLDAELQSTIDNLLNTQLLKDQEHVRKHPNAYTDIAVTNVINNYESTIIPKVEVAERAKVIAEIEAWMLENDILVSDCGVEPLDNFCRESLKSHHCNETECSAYQWQQYKLKQGGQ